MARVPVRRDEVDGSDEEFVHHLARGSDLIGRGEAEPALAALERARELRPKDPKVLGLLGQVLYKAGRYEEAVEAYQRLVDETPVESAARVNLGLANLKARRYPQAVRQLEVALELSPDHRRAMKYLGLAWLEQGEPLRARSWFERAGSAQMVARCDELLGLAAAPPAAATAAPASRGDAPAPPRAAETAAAGSPSAVPEVRGFVEPRPAPGALEGTFALNGGVLATAVAGDVLVRAEGLLAVRGGVRLTPELKRFRGRATDQPFGEGPHSMVRASGEGALLHALGERRLARLPLRSDPAYFREDVVFAFEGAVAFENGRVASGGGPDVHLVHLRGGGDVLLVVQGALLVVEVTAGAPVRVRLGALVGWTGALTPSVTTLDGAADPAAGGGAASDVRAMELSGQGQVLVDAAAA